MRLLRAGPTYSIKKVTGIVFLSILPLALSILITSLYDNDHPIAAIIQTGTLQTAHLAELLDLSVDKPTLLGKFDTKKGEQILLETSIFSDVKIKKIKPNCLSISYKLRQPIAILGNRTNTAIGQDGVLFPLFPAHYPKKLPEILITSSAHPWGEKVDFDHTLLNDSIVCVDLTHPREITLKTSFGDLVRLEKSTQQLPLYYKLRAELLKKPSIVDLRLKECAFIQEIDE